MIVGGKKFEKTQKSKTKYDEYDNDRETFKQVRKKHKDKSLRRLQKQDRYEGQ